VEITIDAMTAGDWPAVQAIYQDGIASGDATFETETPPWEAWDAAHHRFARLAARDGAQLIGWAALSPVSRRQCYAGAAEVSVYVAAAARGRGIGRRLLQSIIRESERHGIWTLQGATFATNEASLRLQRSCGFREIGRRVRIAQLHGQWRDTVITNGGVRSSACRTDFQSIQVPLGQAASGTISAGRVLDRRPEDWSNIVVQFTILFRSHSLFVSRPSGHVPVTARMHHQHSESSP
jgi:phosphinothricin acetyltransferase